MLKLASCYGGTVSPLPETPLHVSQDRLAVMVGRLEKRRVQRDICKHLYEKESCAKDPCVNDVILASLTYWHYRWSELMFQRQLTKTIDVYLSTTDVPWKTDRTLSFFFCAPSLK